MNQPWISFHNHADIVEKFNNVCHVVHELASIIKQLEHKIGEIEKKQKTEQMSQRDANSLTGNIVNMAKDDFCPSIKNMSKTS